MSALEKRIAYSKKLRSKTSLTKRALVRKSNCHLYIVVTDDVNHTVIKEFSTHQFAEKGKRKSLNGQENAKKLAESAAEFLKGSYAGEKFLFDRRHYKHHGVVKVLSDTLRSHGIIS